MEAERKEFAEFSINCNETTSPSQLQEVTLDPDSTFSCAMGIRSPNGPLRGRSVKEFEEQLTNLRKENFNLKLRIYFLEERMGNTFNLDKENAVKQNIELKVEVESLRKDVQEKQDLLCQAVKAMELEEDEHKKSTQQREKELSDLHQQMEVLQQKYQLFPDDLPPGNLDDPRELYAQAFDLREVSQTDVIKDLQAKIEHIQTQLSKEQNHVVQLENILQDAECTKVSSEHAEFELKQKDEKVKRLICELEDKGKKLSSCNLRIQALEDELSNQSGELLYKTKEIRSKDVDLKERQTEIEELRKLLCEAQSLYEAEQRKVEKHKGFVMQRNNKIMELEGYIEKQKSKIMNLETRLESAQNEVKRKTDELHAFKSPRRPKQASTDVDSFLVRSPSNVTAVSAKKASSKLRSPSNSPLRSSQNSSTSSLLSPSNRRSAKKPEATAGDENAAKEKFQSELMRSQKQVSKLEHDQLKACKIIQSMLDIRKEHTKEIDSLQVQLKRKEGEISELREMLKVLESTPSKDNNSGKSLQKRISELNLTATLNPPADSENSTGEETDDEMLLQQYKELTSELDKQKQLLMETLKEKDVQMQILKSKHDELMNELGEKENRIIDLEFEMLTAAQDESVSFEKKDDGNEKPCSFWIHELAEKDREIERLEGELRKRTCDLQGLVNTELWEKNREIEKVQKRYAGIIETKDAEIGNLEKDISGKDLQLTILKDKISELGVHVNLPPNLMQSSTCSRGDASCPNDMQTLQEQLRICKEERKYFTQQIDELKQQLKNTPERDNIDQVQRLKDELKQTQEQLEKCETLRQETGDVCTILGNRLEELAQFLDSLLKQKSVLGFLGSRQNTKLRQIVDQSLDLSRTLSMSVSLNPDQSLMQLSNISILLNATRADNFSIAEFLSQGEEHTSVLSIVPENATLTYQSHLKQAEKRSVENIVAEQTEIITVLREQVENLKREIELRDVEFNKLAEKPVENDQEFINAIMDIHAVSPGVLSPQRILENLMEDKTGNDKLLNTSTTLKYRSENQSESESWSEPDRNVSKARIGLLEDSLKPHPNVSVSRRSRSAFSTESTEEDRLVKCSRKSSYSENRQTIIALHEQVCELENLLAEKETRLLDLELSHNETHKLLETERNKSQSLILQREELLNKVNATETSLAQTEVIKAEIENRLDELREAKRELELNMVEKDKATYNKINELEMEKTQALEAVLRSDKIAEDAKSEIQVAEEQLKAVREEIQAVDQKIRLEAETNLRTAQEEFEVKVKSIESRTEAQIKKITETADELQKKYELEYIKQAEVDKLRNELLEMELIRDKVLQAERKVAMLEETENSLKLQLLNRAAEHHDKIETLRVELDAANLQYSEAILEKTRIVNEKAELEVQIQDFVHKEHEFVRQVDEFQYDFKTMKETFQKQLVALQNQKSSCEVRISELESTNAELHNRLVKIQTGRTGDHVYSSSAPTSPNKVLEYVSRSLSEKHINPSIRRQFSENSGYTSEDVAEDSSARRGFGGGTLQNNADVERNHSSSSPDLGIESDHGRFSSLETNVLPRPFLQSLELTASMSNLLDGEPSHHLVCANEQCCSKTSEIISENSDLRRRLLRTRRALEETVTQLTLANQRKKQVEKTICKQIHKTSQVLRKAKQNLDSGSESDMTRK